MAKFGDINKAPTSTTGGIPSFSSFEGFGSFTKFGSTPLDTPADLLELARQQGGAVAEAAEELADPRKGMLSTMSSGFKNAFKGFVDIISKPSEIVAGIISPEYTIDEAMKEHIRSSDVIFGESDKDLTAMQKVGSWTVRFAADVLLDPLTYVTFGAGQGLLGVRSTAKVMLGKKAAKTTGKQFKDLAPLSKKGQELYLKGIEVQRKGLTSTAQKNAKLRGLDDEGTNRLVRETIDAELDRDMAKNAISAMIERNPALASTFLDKGGIKFFGKTILAGQRIRAVGSLIPGMKLLDHVTSPARRVMGGLFNRNIDVEFGRLPELDAQIIQKYRDLHDAGKIRSIDTIANAWRELGITSQEDNMLFATIEASKRPADPRLAAAYDLARGINKNTLRAIRDSGLALTEVPNYMTHFLVDEEIKSIPFTTSPRSKIKQAQEATIAKFVSIKTGEKVIGSAKSLGLEALVSEDEVIRISKDLNDYMFAANLDIFDLREEIINLSKQSKDIGLLGKLPIEERSKYLSVINAMSDKIPTAIPDSSTLVTKIQEAGALDISDIVKSAGEKIGRSAPQGVDALAELAKTAESQEAFLKQVKDTDLLERLGIPKESFPKDRNINDFFESARTEVTELGEEISDIGRTELGAEDIFGVSTEGEAAKRGFEIERMPVFASKVTKEEEDAILAEAFKLLNIKVAKGIDTGKEGAMKALASFKNSDQAEAIIEAIKRGDKTFPKIVPQYSKEQLSSISKAESVFNKLEVKSLSEFNKALTGIEGGAFATRGANKIAHSLKLEDSKQLFELVKETGGKVVKKVKEVPPMDTETISRFLAGMAEQYGKNPVGISAILDTAIGTRKQAIKDMLSEIGLAKSAAKQDMETLSRPARFFRDNSGEVFERTRATAEDAASIGVKFDTNTLSVLARSSLNVNKGTTIRNMIEDLSRQAGVVASEAPGGWREVNLSLMREQFPDFVDFFNGTKAEKLHFHPATAKKIEEFMGAVINDEATNTLLGKFDKLQNLWKASVTSIFPAFHGRNAISNVFLHMADIGLHSLNPANHIMSASIINNNRKLEGLMSKMSMGNLAARDEYVDLLNKVVMTDKSGYEWTMGELRRTLKDTNVAFNHNTFGSIDVFRSPSELYEEVAPHMLTGKQRIKYETTKRWNPFSGQFELYKGGRKVASAIEEQARILDFMVNLRHTGDVGLAAERTKMFLFDYQNLSNFEKTVMRRLVPFYTFSRKNLELQAKALLTTPGRTAAQVTAVRDLGDVMSGASLSEEEYNSMPQWMRNGLSIVIDRKKSNVEFFQLGLPIEQVFNQMEPNQMLSSISPILKVPLEHATGHNFFMGKPLSQVTDASGFVHAPKILQNFIGFTRVEGKRADGSKFTENIAMRPERMNLILNMPLFSRTLSSLKQMDSSDVSKQIRALQFFTGIKPFTRDLEVEAIRREAELKKKLEEILTRARITATFERTFIPAD